jgi:DNA-binding response OmpR family regulator
VAHLLVVDDEPRICRFVSRALVAHGHLVETARTGEDALAAAGGGDFDLIVLDLLLPGIDGYDVLARLLAQNEQARVLVLSAVGDVESRVRCLRMGAMDFLPKPFAVAELLARVDSRLVARPTRPPSRWLDVGDLRLDLQTRVLHDGDRSITLSQREFVLLVHLMRKAGEVCTRDELLGEVWGYRWDPDSNVVDVCVGRLRSKLARRHIETVRNVGYCFSA